MSVNGAETLPPAIRVTGVALCAGEATGTLLALVEPLSFWGGTDRATGMIIDAHHPAHGASVAGRVLLMEASRGSSSSSSVLAEQLRAGVGPAAMLMTARDAIVALGALAAAELYDIHMPLVLVAEVDAAVLRAAAGAGRVSVTAGADGTAAVVLAPEPPAASRTSTKGIP